MIFIEQKEITSIQALTQIKKKKILHIMRQAHTFNVDGPVLRVLHCYSDLNGICWSGNRP